MRVFKEFNHDGDNAVLEVFCYRLLPGEVEELINLLQVFTFQNIQEDALLAKIEGKYKDVWAVMEKLKDNGFSWRGDE